MIELDTWEEVVGRLKGVLSENLYFVAVFRGFDVFLPITIDNSIIKKLEGLKGTKIGIIRTDIPDKEYLVRKC